MSEVCELFNILNGRDQLNIDIVTRIRTDLVRTFSVVVSSMQPGDSLWAKYDVNTWRHLANCLELDKFHRTTNFVFFLWIPGLYLRTRFVDFKFRYFADARLQLSSPLYCNIQQEMGSDYDNSGPVSRRRWMDAVCGVRTGRRYLLVCCISTR